MPTKQNRPQLSQAYVENYPPLKAWLDAIEARCNWQLPLQSPSGKTFVEQWQAPNGAAFIIVVYPNGNGWNVFTPCPSNHVAETLSDASARLDVHPVPPETMPWSYVCAMIAQGAMNIEEGHTTIEKGSAIHKAMHAFCTHVQVGHMGNHDLCRHVKVGS